MNYNVNTIKRQIGIEEIDTPELNMVVTDINKVFKLFDIFKYGERIIKVYKNNEDIYYFSYANDSNLFSNDKDSRLVPHNIISKRIRMSNKYTFDNLYKLNTINPFDNYLVDEKTLYKLTKYKYYIVPNPVIAHGYKLYNR